MGGEMQKSNKAFGEDTGLIFAAAAYYAVMLGAFVVGLYGLFSLIWLANAEVQRSVQVMGSLH
jgi:hypothetical protein